MLARLLLIAVVASAYDKKPQPTCLYGSGTGDGTQLRHFTMDNAAKNFEGSLHGFELNTMNWDVTTYIESFDNCPAGYDICSDRYAHFGWDCDHECVKTLEETNCCREFPGWCQWCKDNLPADSYWNELAEDWIYRKVIRVAHTETKERHTHITPSNDQNEGGFCGIASKNERNGRIRNYGGRNRLAKKDWHNNMWVVQNSGANNWWTKCANNERQDDGSLWTCSFGWWYNGQHHDSRTVDNFQLADHATADSGTGCALSTKHWIDPISAVDAPEHAGRECIVELDLEEIGNLEASGDYEDKFTLSVTGANGRILAEASHSGDIRPEGSTMNLNTGFFAANGHFKVTMTAANGNHGWRSDAEYHLADDLKVRCRACASAPVHNEPDDKTDADPACDVKCCRGDWKGEKCVPSKLDNYDSLMKVLHASGSEHIVHRCYRDDDHENLCRCQCAPIDAAFTDDNKFYTKDLP